MKPSEKLIKLLNYRVNQEELSSRIYYAMSVWLNNQGYKSSKLWKKYSDEELVHANKVTEFLLSFGIMPEIQTIESIETEYSDLVNIIKLSFEHEMEISRQCEELYKAGVKEDNPMVIELGRWFVAEQIEELNKTQTLMDMVTTFYDGSKVSLRMLDNELGE